MSPHPHPGDSSLPNSAEPTLQPTPVTANGNEVASKPASPAQHSSHNIPSPLLRDRSSSDIDCQRRELNAAIAKAETEIRQARDRILAIPKQTQPTLALLDEFLSYATLCQNLEEKDPNSINDIKEQRNTLRDRLSPTPTADLLKSPAPILPSLNLLERTIKQLDDLAKRQETQANPALKSDIDSAQQLLQKVQSLREDYYKSQETPGILSEELNQLQYLLGQIRYEVSAARRLSTLNRFAPQIEQISQTAQSIQTDQVGITSLVSATSLEIDRWLCRYRWNFASIPTGWFLGYFFNRYRDVSRLLSRVSGIRGASYSDKNTTKGKVIAGLLVSLLIWLSIFFGVSLLMLIGKIVVQSVAGDSTKRISAAKAEVSQVETDVLNSLTTLANSQTQLPPLPTDQKVALQQSDQKIQLITGLLATQGVRLLKCNIDSISASSAPGTALNECRSEVNQVIATPAAAGAAQGRSAPVTKSSPPAKAQPETQLNRQQLLDLLNLELQSLEANQQLDKALLNYAAVSQITPPGKPSPLTTQLNLTRDQISAQLDKLKENENVLTLIDFLNSLDPKKRADLNQALENLKKPPSSNNQNVDPEFLQTLKEFNQNLKSYNASAESQGISNVFFQWSTNTTYTEHIYRFLLALLAGGIGGIVSIFTRLDDIEKQNPSSPFLLGLLQPLIGATFSIVVMLVLSTPAVEVIKVLPRELYLQDPTTSGQSAAASSPKPLTSREVYLILIVGFLIGFSERFAKNAFNSISPNT